MVNKQNSHHPIAVGREYDSLIIVGSFKSTFCFFFCHANDENLGESLEDFIGLVHCQVMCLSSLKLFLWRLFEES